MLRADGHLAPEAGAVIGHAQGQQNEEEEDGAGNDQAGQLFVRVLYVHEEQDDEDRFEGGNAQGDDGVGGAEIHESYGGSEAGADQQDDPDQDRGAESGDVLVRRLVLRGGGLWKNLVSHDF